MVSCTRRPSKALHWVGQIAFLTGQYAAAGQAWQRMPGHPEKLPAQPALVQPGAAHVGGLYRDQYDFPRAEEFLKRASTCGRRASERNTRRRANILVDAWPPFQMTGDYARAEAHFLRALGMYERAGRHYKHVRRGDAFDAGPALLALGDLDKAESLATRFRLKIREKLGHSWR